MKIIPIAIIDTREQTPLRFENMPTESGTLGTGDYSIKGLTHLVAVERKSLDDLLGCTGRSRARFKRELQRLRAYRYRLIAVETDAATLEAGVWRSRVKPSHVLGSLAAWSAQYKLPIWLAGTHAAAGRHVERFLFQAARAIASENLAVVSAKDVGSAKANLAQTTLAESMAT